MTATAPRDFHVPGGWPWQLGDLLGVAVTNLVAIGLLFGGLEGIRHTTDPHTLLLLLEVSVAGVIASLAGNTVFVLTGLRQIRRLRADLLQTPSSASPPVLDRPAKTAESKLVAASNMTRFHLSDCPGAAGKVVTAAALDTHLALHRRPCGLCLPGSESAHE